MLLISATPSPFARKVRIALLEKGVPFDLRNEIPWHADTQTPLYNPLEQLPILIPDDGEPVYESTYIMEWIEHRYPEPAMLPANPDQALEAKRVQVLAEGVMDATVLLFWELGRDHPSADWTKRQIRKVRGGLEALDCRLGERDYYVNDQFGLGDIAVVSVLGMQDVAEGQGSIENWQSFDPLIDHWRSLYPNLARFEAMHRDRPSVRDTAPVMFSLAEKVA